MNISTCTQVNGNKVTVLLGAVKEVPLNKEKEVNFPSKLQSKKALSGMKNALKHNLEGHSEEAML